MPSPETNAERQEPETEPSAASAGESAGTLWPLVAFLLLAAAALFVVQMRRPKAADPLVGRPLPPLEVAGWLNTERPLTVDDLAGKIVVVDFWGSWCGDCAASMPDLVEFYRRYHEHGVVLVGLTAEPAEEVEAVRRFLSHFAGADWPVGYGAWLAAEVMGIEWWPTYVLYDRSSRVVWSGASVDELEDAVVNLLAKE